MHKINRQFEVAATRQERQYNSALLTAERLASQLYEDLGGRLDMDAASHRQAVHNLALKIIELKLEDSYA